MVKSVISMLMASLILLFGAIYEENFVIRQFEEFDVAVGELKRKIDDETAVEGDVLAVQDNYLNKKKYLHIFIPHNEIKEMELWLSETVILVRDKEWTDARSKIEVLGELSEQIPKTFKISIENIL